MSITFHQLSDDNLEQVLKLSITKEQRYESQLGTVGEIIEEMFAIEEIQQNIIYDGGLPVGYIAFRVFPGDGKSGGIDRFFIDHRYQKKGYGTAALQLALKTLCDDQCCESIQLNYMNFAFRAVKLYTQCGFIEKPSDDEWGEVVAVYTHQKRNNA